MPLLHFSNAKLEILSIAANAAMPAIVFSFAIYPFTEPPVIPST